MVKTEAFDDSHFMNQAVRVGHTDHTGSIVSPMACIFDLKIEDACHGRNDATSVISMTNSNSLVHKMRIVKRFIPRL